MSLFSEVSGQFCRTDYPAEARDVYDVTGAGDTAIATLAVMLSEGRSLVDAARIANRAAGLVVGKFGTSSVSRTELFGSVPDSLVKEAL
jgi:bifunctional ADP-heptose synthase (sugar kinase/adenylyltransferase)